MRRSSVARHLGLPTAGLPVPSRPIDRLIEVVLDATQRYDVALSLERLWPLAGGFVPDGLRRFAPQPGLPLRRGRCQTMTHYKRNGVTALVAALNTLDRSVIGQCMNQYSHQEWLRFLP